MTRAKLGSRSAASTSTTSSAAPKIDLARIRRFCRDRIPERARHLVRLEVEVTGRRITIIERRPPWKPEFGPDWSSLPIAQLRLHATEATWTLFWCDSNHVWHRDPIEATPQVDRLLARIAEDPGSYYWG